MQKDNNFFTCFKNPQNDSSFFLCNIQHQDELLSKLHLFYSGTCFFYHVAFEFITRTAPAIKKRIIFITITSRHFIPSIYTYLLHRILYTNNFIFYHSFKIIMFRTHLFFYFYKLTAKLNYF